MSNKEVEGKNIAQYNVIYSAYINTRIERDKILITLSSGAIGLLITIISIIEKINILNIILFTISIILFILTIIKALKTYEDNTKYLENAIRGINEKNTTLNKFDKWSFRTFILGIIFSLLIGLSIGYTKLNSNQKSKINNLTTQEK